MEYIDKNFLEYTEKLGKLYCEKHLSEWKQKQLSDDWWIALQFFFSHSFMRGRRDSLSNDYYYFSKETLNNFFRLDESLEISNIINKKYLFDSNIIKDFKSGNKNSIKQGGFNTEISNKNELIKILTTKTSIEVKWQENKVNKELFLGNDKDIIMVLDTLRFIASDKERHNIYQYALQKITNNETDKLYNELNDEIYGIGDKIATFLIRDILLLNPDIKIKQNHIKYGKYAFPIDTWILTISKKIGIKTEKVEDIKDIFIKNAITHKLCPYRIAAGLWYLGFNSLDILLKETVK